MSGIQCNPIRTPLTDLALRPSALGLDVGDPVHFRSDCVTFDGDGAVKAIDLSDGIEMTARSGNGSDSISVRAKYYELALGGGHPLALSLPGLEGDLSTRMEDTEVTVTGRVSLAALRTAGVFAETETDGTRSYSIEAGPLRIALRGSDRFELLEEAADVTTAARETALAAAHAFMQAFEATESRFSAVWRGIIGEAPRVESRFTASAWAQGKAGDIAREALLTQRLAQAAYERVPAPSGAERVDIRDRVDTSSGFSADLFRTRVEGRETLVLAYRGTDEAKDWLTNLAHVFRVPEQYAQAVRLAGQIRAENPRADVILTGHSLGGGLAAFSGLMTDTRSYAFNSAGIQLPTALSLPRGADLSLVTHINTAGDPLTGLFGPMAGRNWGDTSCVVREPTTESGEFTPEFKRSVQNRTLAVAQWLEHHRIGSVVAKLSDPNAMLDCTRVH